jgi:hypothetical protein
MVDEQCQRRLGELIAPTTIFETAPFTPVESAGAQAPATTTTSVAGDGN